MTRQAQVRLPGTERKDHPQIEEVALGLSDLDDKYAEISRKKKEKKYELAAVMRACKVRSYKYYDPKRERYRIARIEEGEEKILVEDTDEALPEIGGGVATGGDPSTVAPGLIAMAMKAQDDANVEESADGDVVVPDKAAPKGKRGKKDKPS